MRILGQPFDRSATAFGATALFFALATGCGGSGGDAPSAPKIAPSSAPSSAPSPQVNTGLMVVPLVTYDGSGQAVHPDGAMTPPGWGATTSHVVATPYPGGSARFENPSYYDVVGFSSWVAPAHATNPLASPGAGHLSDPDMVYDPDSRQLWVYYREASDMNRIFLIRSADGTHWSTPVLVLEVPDHLAVSPSVVRRGPGDWLMWTVNSGSDGCTATSTSVEVRHSQDGVTWGPPDLARMGRNDQYPWHVDVEWIPSRHEYWAVYNAKRSGSCMTALLRFATSQDGVSWTEYPSALLRAGAIPEFADVVYRSSIAYDSASDVVTLLYSGARATDSTYVWNVATELVDRTTLMARVSAPAPTMSSHARMSPHDVPELTNETAP